MRQAKELQFPDLFGRATGRPPYRYQDDLAATDPVPEVLAVPTGSGKTQALLASWLHQRLRGKAPRRLVYALPMRTLVEQTASVALEMRDRLGLTADELPVHVLMGGVEAGDWREHPERDQILIGTIDEAQLLDVQESARRSERSRARTRFR